MISLLKYYVILDRKSTNEPNLKKIFEPIAGFSYQNGSPEYIEDLYAGQFDPHDKNDIYLMINPFEYHRILRLRFYVWEDDFDFPVLTIKINPNPFELPIKSDLIILPSDIEQKYMDDKEKYYDDRLTKIKEIIDESLARYERNLPYDKNVDYK